MSRILLNTPLIDYITLTSFRDQLYQTGIKLMSDIGGKEIESKVMQYDGVRMDIKTGQIFVGTGIQKNALHNMVRISGQAAQDAIERFARVFMPYQDSVTRIDFQITILEPDDWSQWALLERLRKSGRPVGWVASRDKETGHELATVYIGTRSSSPRFVRIYQKLTDDGDKLLRLEVEIKRKRAREHGKYLMEYASGNMDKARDELAFICQHDYRLELAFSHAIQNWKKPITVGSRSGNTSAWIKTQCLPAIARYLNDHSTHDSAEIVSVMKQIIRSTEL